MRQLLSRGGCGALYLVGLVAENFAATKRSTQRSVPETVDYIADVRISIGCLSSHKLKTLKAIIPASIGS